MDAMPNEKIDARIARRRQQNVARVLRYRKRARDGGVVFRMEIDGADIDTLVRFGMLSENQRHDAAAVRDLVKALSEDGFRFRARNNAAPPPAASKADAALKISEANRRALASLET